MIGDQLLLFIVYQKSCQIHAHGQCFGCSSFFEIMPVFKFSDQMSRGHTGQQQDVSRLLSCQGNLSSPSCPEPSWLAACAANEISDRLWMDTPSHLSLSNARHQGPTVFGGGMFHCLPLPPPPLSTANTLVLRQCEHIANHDIKRIQNVNSSI